MKLAALIVSVLSVATGIACLFVPSDLVIYFAIAFGVGALFFGGRATRTLAAMDKALKGDGG